ncbi:MAG: TolC family protein [Melioribacteraceae bacterium]|nr:TolC family protein [Melioribacteraceae bacterium]MCF8394377.1 TolC family protein [Melioribacteraceae bacterium]MCF8420087.1 TolC family protein [Melioribacteraceae bacterium]
MKPVILFLALILSFVSVDAQQLLNLQDALDIALGESYDIKSAEYTLLASQKNLEAAKLGLLSSVDLEFDLPRYSRSLSSQFNTATGTEQFFDIGNTTVEGRLFVNQPIIFTNGTVSLIGSMFGRDQFGSGFLGTRRDYYSNLSISLRQPLFVFNDQAASLERAEINLEKTERNYTRTEREIIYNVTSNFYNLYKSKKNVEIAEEKVRQTESSFETASNKLKAGLIAEVEALQLEVDLASSRNELLNSKQNYQDALNEFKLLIGLTLSDDIDIEAQIEYMPVKVDLNDAVLNAIKNRPDILNAEDDIYLSGLRIDEIDSRRTIKAELNANYGINKNDDLFNKIFNDFDDSRRVTMTLSIPVWDWGQNGREVEAAEANYKLSQLNHANLEDQIEKEVIAAINKLNSAKARVEVLSKSVDVAEKSYNISLERFKSGTITSFDLSQVQLRLTDAKLNSLSALIDYKIALADLERKTYLDY